MSEPTAGRLLVGGSYCLWSSRSADCARAALAKAAGPARLDGRGVVGTHGERPLLGVVLGSTAYELLHRSTVPVLVVPAARGS